MKREHETTEEATFKNLEKTRENNVTFNHTEPDADVSSPNKSALLNSHLSNTDGTRRIIGPAKGLKVYPGDVIDMEAYASYEYVNTDETSATAFLFAAMTASFGIQAGENPQVFNAFNSLIGGTALINQNPGDVPKAFLNYIYFDKNYANPEFGFDQVSSAGDGDHDMLTLNKSITEEGYIYIYVSNESTLNVNVYFDDLKITHSSASMVVQANDYYPFGLTMKPSDFQRDGEKGNDFLYNGFELQEETGWYDYLARQYDPAIGRFTSVDPAADLMRRHSPYNYALNNPIRFIDPDGMIPEDISRQVTSTDNTDVITETRTQTSTTKRTVKEGTDEYVELLGKSTITSSNGIGGAITVVESTKTTVESNTTVEYDDQGNEMSRTESGSTTTESSLNVVVSDQFGGTAGGFTENSSSITATDAPTISEGLSGLVGDAVGFRGENGVSITNRDEYASAIKTQQALLDIISYGSPFAGVGVGAVLRKATILVRSGVGTVFSLSAMGIEGSVRSGLNSLKNKSPGCNNCTKNYK